MMAYISNTNLFNTLSDHVMPVCNWHYTQADADTYYFDWSEFQVGGFVPFINALAMLSNDSRIYFYDLYPGLEPGVVDQYYKNFMQYPMIEFPIGIAEIEYLKTLDEKFFIKDYYVNNKLSYAEKFRDRYFIVSATCKYVIFPQSMRWHIYGEYDIELARLVTTVGLPDNPNKPPHGFMTNEEAYARIKLLS